MLCIEYLNRLRRDVKFVFRTSKPQQRKVNGFFSANSYQMMFGRLDRLDKSFTSRYNKTHQHVWHLNPQIVTESCNSNIVYLQRTPGTLSNWKYGWNKMLLTETQLNILPGSPGKVVTHYILLIGASAGSRLSDILHNTILTKLGSEVDREGIRWPSVFIGHS